MTATNNSPILTKTLSDGRSVEVYLSRINDEATATVYIDGALLCSSNYASCFRLAGHPQITRLLGKLSLTEAEGQLVNQALGDDNQANPARRTINLRAARKAIVDAIREHNDVASASRDKWFESGTGAGKLAQYGSPELTAQLAAFDAANPEIIAAIKAEKAAANTTLIANLD